MNRKDRRRHNKNVKNHLSLPQMPPGEILSKLEQAGQMMRSGAPDAALSISEEILLAAPSHPDALNLKAACFMALGKKKNALPILTKIAQLLPDYAQAHFNLGTALNAMAKPKRAIASFQQALALNPSYADAHYNLANALRQTGQTCEAIKHYQLTLKQSPNHSAAATNLASAFLEQGNAAEAYAACQLALNVEPGNRDALSFAAIAATESGNPQQSAEILKPELLIRPKLFDARPGYDSINAFNSALVAHVLNHPTLVREPHNKATRNGQQTENLALGERGPVAELQNMIGEALDIYLEDINKNNMHPYPPLIPHLTKIDIWGTVLGAQGHQTSHMHRAAWISGVYYAKLPDVMHTGQNGQAGWIEFCRPPDEFPCKQTHNVKMIEPKEGLMVLFPSYIYHRTIPFESDDKRISIAFDLLA